MSDSSIPGDSSRSVIPSKPIRDPSTYPEDPFPIYNPPNNEIDFDSDDADDIRAGEYQKAKWPFRTLMKPDVWQCDGCSTVLHELEDDVRYHCSECGCYDLCETCFIETKKGVHTHRNGDREESFFYRITQANWRYASDARFTKRQALGIGQIEKHLFEAYGDRQFLGTRPSSTNETIYWMSYADVYARSVALAKSLLFLQKKKKKESESESESESEVEEIAEPGESLLMAPPPGKQDRAIAGHLKSSQPLFVGILSGIRISAPVVWFGSHFAGWAHYTIPRIVSVQEKTQIVRQAPPEVIFTESCHLEEVKRMFQEQEEEDEDETEETEGEVLKRKNRKKVSVPLIVLMDRDVDEWLLHNESCEPDAPDSSPYGDLVVVHLSAFLAMGEETETELEPPTETDESREGELSEFEPVEVDPSAVGTLFYTSGTSGCPKGVVFTFDTLKMELHFAYVYAGDMVRLAYAPFSHLSGYHAVYMSFFNGGKVATLCESDLAHFFDDCRILRPTALSLFPRIVQFIYDQFNSRVLQAVMESESFLRGGEKAVKEACMQEVYQSMRDIFGDRVTGLSVGSAHCTWQLKRFLRQLCRCPVQDGFGITETGTVSQNYIVEYGVAWDIVACPELGYSPDDTPYPRGELIVKTTLVRRLTYYKNEEAFRARVDEKGYFHTGDIVEKRGENRIRIIDRRSNVVKLSQGEFISLERIEGVFELSPLLSQVVVFPNPKKTCFVAIVQVRPSEDDEGLPDVDEVLSELQKFGSEGGVPHWAIPLLCHVTSKELPLTSVKKKSRNRIHDVFREVLTQIFVESESHSSFNMSEHLQELLGVRGLDLQAIWDDCGGDSMSGTVLVSTLRSVGIALPYSEVKRMALGEILDLFESASSSPKKNCSLRRAGFASQDVVSPLEDLHRLRQIVKSLRSDNSYRSEKVGTMPASPTIFLTGASGFLGGEILRVLIGRGEQFGRIICIVRPSSVERMQKWASDRIEILSGDLEEDLFGLDDESFPALAARVDVVIHCGAMVNHFLSYDDHYAANVRSLFDIVRLSGGWKPIVFVSSMSVWSSVNPDTATIRSPQHTSAQGYAASKWVPDLLLSELCSDHSLIIRPPLVAASSSTGRCNMRDWLCRSIGGMLECSCAPVSASDDPFDMIPGDILAGFIVHLLESGKVKFGAVNIRCENISAQTLLGFVQRFYEEELEEVKGAFSRISLEDWTLKMEDSVPGVAPFARRMRKAGVFGDRGEFLACEMPRLEAYLVSVFGQSTVSKMSYEEFGKMGRRIRASSASRY